MLTRLEKRRGKGACPTFLCAAIREASQGGPSHSYAHVGAQMIGGVSGLAPNDVEQDEWMQRVAQLEEIFCKDDDRGIIAWFTRNVPRVMAMIPYGRRDMLLRGMREEVKRSQGACFYD
jgi:hypothetical protein